MQYDGHVLYGLLEGEIIRVLKNVPYINKPEFTGMTVPLAEARLLAPCEPSKIVCLGLNYKTHAAEVGMPLPAEPLLFLKPSSAIIGPAEIIQLPEISARVDYEAELAVVIGRRARHVSSKDAAQYIWGYTCANDITARDLQKRDGQWTRAKSFDTFLPLGPWIETELDPADLEITLYQNGILRQRSRSSDLIFTIPELVSYISAVMTLLPGDVIITGTPSGIGPLADGDRVEVTIEGVGTLRNSVRKDN
jgi:2-keto-4-pentenoate hydratase/2-oxohepta-3-ene-1,7-dioic acid hydratase in catechol pathway